MAPDLAVAFSAPKFGGVPLHIVMAYIVMAYVVMAYIAMAYIVMALLGWPGDFIVVEDVYCDGYYGGAHWAPACGGGGPGRARAFFFMCREVGRSSRHRTTSPSACFEKTSDLSGMWTKER